MPPSKSRRSDRPPRPYIIALIFPPGLSYSRAHIEGVIDRHLEHRDWIIIEVPRLRVGESPLPSTPVHLDGAIVWAEPRDVWVNDLVARGIPVVNCGFEWVGTPGVASVHFDFREIEKIAVAHFVRLGLRRLVAVGHKLAYRPATRSVLEGIVARARASGLESRVFELGGEASPSILPQRLLEPEAETELGQFLQSLKTPAGIYSGDHAAFIICRVASRLGLRVPDDLAIMGQGDNAVARFCIPPLTTITGDARAVGRAAADSLAAWLADGTPPPAPVVVRGANLIVRESTLGKSGSVVLEAVRRFIAARARTGVTVGELVSLSGLSEKTLVRKYREAFGTNPADEIHRLRLREAKSLLATVPRRSIADVSTACGFASQAAFTNFFVRHAGLPPSDWRARHGRRAL